MTTATPTAAVTARGLVKNYGRGDTRVTALDHVDVQFRSGEFTAIMGPSGSGKSTLLHCIAGLDTITDGEVRIGDTQLAGLGDEDLTRLRRERVGFIFQSFNLVPTLTARENITLPMDIAGVPVDEDWLRTLVESLGLSARLDHRPAELSGGQRQRVACARAILSRPAIIAADEPTGNLDSRASEEVLRILRGSVDDHGRTVIMVTHDPRAASRADRILHLADGRIVDDTRDTDLDSLLDRIRRLGKERR